MGYKIWLQNLIPSKTSCTISITQVTSDHTRSWTTCQKSSQSLVTRHSIHHGLQVLEDDYFQVYLPFQRLSLLNAYFVHFFLSMKMLLKVMQIYAQTATVVLLHSNANCYTKGSSNITRACPVMINQYCLLILCPLNFKIPHNYHNCRRKVCWTTLNHYCLKIDNLLNLEELSVRLNIQDTSSN